MQTLQPTSASVPSMIGYKEKGTFIRNASGDFGEQGNPKMFCGEDKEGQIPIWLVLTPYY